MAPTAEQFVLRVMSGEARGAAPALLRGAMRAGEPFYAGAMTLRNALFDRGVKRVHRLPRPVVSVGNVTAGGTGKTPVIRWLADELGAMKPAVLMRGYRAARTGQSDEAAMLAEQLGPDVPVEANPDRVAGASAVLARRPEVGVFLLDDGFQHRRVARDVDLVLVNATDPFGFGHVHPRGLLREPLRGLARATAFVLTRSDQVEPRQLADIEATIRRHNALAPIFRAAHAQTGVRSADATVEPIDALRDRPFFAFSGIGNPDSFRRQLAGLGRLVGFRVFPDHHAYTAADLARLRADASAAGAAVVLTTDKDWVKLRTLPGAADGTPAIARVELRVRFAEGDDRRLLDLIAARIGRAG